MTCGIYKITLIDDGRCYVGQSIDIESRWKRERSELRNGKFNGKAGHHLQCAWAKYSEDAFTFEIVEVVDIDGLTEAEADAVLTAREQWWMDNTESEFNKRPAAGSMRGYRFTDEQRAYMRSILNDPERRALLSEVHRRRWTPELRAAFSANNPMRDPEVVERVAAAKRGKPLTEEHRAKIGASHKGVLRARQNNAQGRARRNAATGKTQNIEQARNQPPATPEFRAKMSEIVRARPPASPETCARISEAKRGWNPSAVTRSRMSASHIGKPWSALRRERYEARKAAREAAKDTDQGG